MTPGALSAGVQQSRLKRLQTEHDNLRAASAEARARIQALIPAWTTRCSSSAATTAPRLSVRPAAGRRRKNPAGACCPVTLVP